MEHPAGLIDTHSVIEFLCSVPMLQRLPSLSIRKIAQAVTIKQYGAGENVRHKGEFWDGLYFVMEGMGEVHGSMISANEERHTSFRLKKFDYFGCNVALTKDGDVIALTKLTCLVLGKDHLNLLQSKTIWNAEGEESTEKCPLVESILQLEPIEVDIFQGITLPDAPKFGKMFGGQFLGQALAAATKTVGCLKVVHSLHASFILVGDFNLPVTYQVHRVRDGGSFSTRRVEAIQKSLVIFTLFASFQKEEDGFEHQEALMPSVSYPEMLLSLEELREKPVMDPRLPRNYRNKDDNGGFIPWPIEIKLCDPTPPTHQIKSPPSLKYWFRAKGKLTDDQALHRCVVAYASDLIFAKVSLYPHRTKDLRPISLSLNHSIWFHRPFKADDWLLFVINSPISHSAKGFVVGQMFNRKGELAVSLTQETLIRKIRPPRGSTIKPKL